MTRLMVVMACLLGAGCAGSDPKSVTNHHRARDEGYEAAIAGIPPEACPYDPRGWLHEHWKRGWAEGFKSRTKATRL